MTTTEQITARLEYLRGEIRAERISYSEIAELQSLAPYIEAGDTELLQWVSESEPVMPSLIFSDEGTVDGVRYVTVLDADYNPIEYEITLQEAEDRYGDHPISWEN